MYVIGAVQMFTMLVWCVCDWGSADVYHACVVCIHVVGTVQMFTMLVWCVCDWDSSDVYHACVVCMWLGQQSRVVGGEGGK